MSKHLIQSMQASPDFSTLHCIKHGASTPKWRTVSIYMAGDGNIVLTGSEDDDSWEFIFDPIQAAFGGEIKFGTCCIWKATVRYYLESSNSDYFGSLIINGTLVDSFERIEGSTGEIVDFEVDLNTLGLINRACGSYWSIGAYALGGDDPKITVEIIDVEFGPPV